MIHVIDYGVGNVQAFVTAYKRLGIEVIGARSKTDLENCTHVILPGVGAFDQAMALLDASKMRAHLDELVLGKHVPVLGVCVGMQMLADRSDEGRRAGLGWISGEVRSFASNTHSSPLPMPHMGWNDVEVVRDSPLFLNLRTDPRFYFLHSFYFEAKDRSDSLATTPYGFSFDCAVGRKHTFGVQFHPEKSHHWGASLLKNFAEI